MAKEAPDFGKTIAEAESLFTFATARLIREGADRYGERWNKYKDEWEAAIRAEYDAAWRHAIAETFTAEVAAELYESAYVRALRRAGVAS